MADKQSKSQIKAAQQKHLADLFGEESVPKQASQQATDQGQARAQQLEDAAQAKAKQLDAAEQAKLAELQARSQQAAQSARPKNTQPPAQAPVKPPLLGRNDLADTAIQNMRSNLGDQAAQPPAQAPQQPPARNQDAAQPPARPPQPAGDPQAQPQRPARRQPPSPEELDRLLRAMARRSPAARQTPPPAGTQPRAPYPPRPMAAGGERGVDAPPPVPEAPPDLPEENPDKNREKQAEIVEQLRAREAQAQEAVQPIPQHDQDRAIEEAVEVNVPITTTDNAVNAAPLHQALADLQSAMKAHDVPGQVHGANDVQQKMPQHPLYQPEDQDES